MKTFAERFIAFNKNLHFGGKLPRGIKVMNPFTDKLALDISSRFYKKYYNDNNPRFVILGINPGRHGAGCTGVPFTDTKRLVSECGMDFPGLKTHEQSSVFVYEVVRAMGGPEAFYSQFYIQSVCPLGFTITNKQGRDVNYNYYDDKKLELSAMPFILENMRRQLELGIHKEIAFCFGTGKNFQFLKKLNEEHGFFKTIIPLEHPRYIMQYKSNYKQEYIDKYLGAFYDAMENYNQPAIGK